MQTITAKAQEQTNMQIYKHRRTYMTTPFTFNAGIENTRKRGKYEIRVPKAKAMEVGHKTEKTMIVKKEENKRLINITPQTQNANLRIT